MGIPPPGKKIAIDDIITTCWVNSKKVDTWEVIDSLAWYTSLGLFHHNKYMLNPLDGWTIAHGIVGFLLGTIRINRWVFYPLPFVWEVYQLYFHYQPKGYDLEYVWLNSLIDILACVLCYEIFRRYHVKYNFNFHWFKFSLKIKRLITYSLITSGITWLFWDDIFRIGLSENIPSPQIPLLLGLVSPAIAAFMVRAYIFREWFVTFNTQNSLNRFIANGGALRTIIAGSALANGWKTYHIVEEKERRERMNELLIELIRKMLIKIE